MALWLSMGHLFMNKSEHWDARQLALDDWGSRDALRRRLQELDAAREVLGAERPLDPGEPDIEPLT